MAGPAAIASTIGEAIARAAGERPRHAALAGADGRRVTYAGLDACAKRVAEDLARAGLGPSHRVGLMVREGLEGAELLAALMSAVTVMPCNPALAPAELLEQAGTAALDAFVVPEGMAVAALAAFCERFPVLAARRSPAGTLALAPLAAMPSRQAPMRAARAEDPALLLRTSGTTGVPKIIAVTHGNLAAMAGHLASPRWLGLGREDRTACVLPLYYAAGIKNALAVPLLLGGTAGFPPAGRAADLAHWAGTLRPTYLAVAPAMLNAIVTRLEKQPLGASSLRFVMSGAAYLPEELRMRAERVLGVPVLEFYGLSEAGIMAANPLHRRKPGTVGVPVPGELRVLDASGAPAPPDAVGEIVVAGPSVTPGAPGWLSTGDLGRLDAEGYLRIVGRSTEVISRGGEKVFPYEVEKALLEHPAVREAAAFAVPHPRLGENVAAAAVLEPGSPVSEQELRQFLATRLARFKVPRRLRLVQSLPRSSGGKVLRRALSEAHAAPRGAGAAPQNLLETELRDMWQRLLGSDDIGIDDDFLDKGGDSLLATEMLLEVEQLTGRAYPEPDLSTLTIRRIAATVNGSLATDAGRLAQVKSGTGVPLFFCHGEHSTRAIYAHRLAAALPGEQPVYLLSPGRAAASRVEDIAAAYVDEVAKIAGGSPVMVGGYCLGGLAAWHLAHLLRARGVSVSKVLLVETISLNARASFRALGALCRAASRALPGKAGAFLRDEAMRSAWRLRRGGLAGLARVVAWRAPQPGDADPAAAAAARMNYRMLARYVPPRLDVPIACFVAEQGLPADTAPAAWRSLAPRVDTVRVTGTHHSVVVSERRALARALGAALRPGNAAANDAPGAHAPSEPVRVSVT